LISRLANPQIASRLVEKGVPLSQVRDLLGHASIVTTERYDNQARQTARPRKPRTPAKPLAGLAVRSGVDDGDRTRNHRSHSPVLCH